MLDLRMRFRRVVGSRVEALLLAVSLAACAHPKPKACTTLVPEPAYVPQTVQISFLGVAGVIVRWQGQAIMSAPLYSNPTVAEMALSEIHADRQRIDGLLRENQHDLSETHAILSGHSHYDHLMEVPYLALHRAGKAEVIGNDSMVKLLEPIRASLGTRKLVSLQDPLPNGHLVPGTRFRIRSVVSQHSAQFGVRLQSQELPLLALLAPLPDVSLWRGEVELPADHLPDRVGEWPGGTALAFVIELLEPASDTVAFRIYYQDSSTRYPWGFPPDGDEYDLAILCMGGATENSAFPGDIIQHLNPRYVMGTHWEDFFNPRPLGNPSATAVAEQISYAPGVDERQFLTAVRAAQPKGGQAIVPCPDKTTVFTRTTSGWTIPAGDLAWTKPKP
jgi:hypothetical protein